MYTYIFTYMYTDIQIYRHTDIQTYRHTGRHTDRQTDSHTRTHTHIYIYIHIIINYSYIIIYIYIYIYARACIMHMSKLCIPACAHNIPTIINQWEEVWDQPATGTWTRLFWNCLCWPLPLQWHAMCCALASSDCFPGSQVRTAACPTGFETPRPFSTPTLRWIWGEAAWQRARWTATGPRFDWGTILVHAMPCCRTPWKARLNRLALYGSFYFFRGLFA